MALRNDGDYGVLSKRTRPYGSLSRRYAGNTGSLGADGNYGVLSYRPRPYGSLSRRYAGNTGSLGVEAATPAPAPAAASPLGTRGAARAMLVGIGIVLAGLTLA
jgi:hypothetical protein